MTHPQFQFIVCPHCGSVRAPLKDVVVVQPKNGLVVANAGVQTTPCPVCRLMDEPEFQLKEEIRVIEEGL